MFPIVNCHVPTNRRLKMVRTQNKSLSPNSQYVSAMLGSCPRQCRRCKPLRSFVMFVNRMKPSPGRSSKRKDVSHHMPVLCQRCKFIWREQLRFYGVITGPNNLYFSLPFYGNITGSYNLCFSLPFYGNFTGPNHLYFSLPFYGNITGPNNFYFSLLFYGNITVPNNLHFSLPFYGNLTGPNNLCFSLQFYGNITGPNNLFQASILW